MNKSHITKALVAAVVVAACFSAPAYAGSGEDAGLLAWFGGIVENLKAMWMD